MEKTKTTTKITKSKELKEMPFRSNEDIVKKPCNVCFGYGWHPLGYLCPIGPIDAGEWGDKVIRCPFCGAGSVDNGERWDMLVAEKKKREAEAAKEASKNKEKKIK